jgi:hypothetical protein
MALFVLGAGATRGASFVDPAQNPCLPPLDLDFYAQLQRIANVKHQKTVEDVIKDTVDLFGVNFQVIMEAVFTTLEHTARMIETTGENRDFKRSDLHAKKDRLMQAIAATLEESLCAGGQRVGTECEHHRKRGDGVVRSAVDPPLSGQCRLKRLVAGVSGYICDQCVTKCVAVWSKTADTRRRSQAAG